MADANQQQDRANGTSQSEPAKISKSIEEIVGHFFFRPLVLDHPEMTKPSMTPQIQKMRKIKMIIITVRIV